MTIPGFTAEASLCGASSHYRQVPSAPADAAGLVSLAQLDAPFRSPSSPSRLGDGAVQPLPTASGPLLEASGLKVYGNWCGPRYGGDGPPIDAVDRVCCQHDKCYDERGDLSCSCERDLLSRMPAAIADPNTSAAGKAWGTGAIAVFTTLPCLCRQELCVPFTGFCRTVTILGAPLVKLCPPGFD